MGRLTAFVLRHKLVVVLFWIVLAVVGGVTTSAATHRLSLITPYPVNPATLQTFTSPRSTTP